MIYRDLIIELLEHYFNSLDEDVTVYNYKEGEYYSVETLAVTDNSCDFLDEDSLIIVIE